MEKEERRLVESVKGIYLKFRVVFIIMVMEIDFSFDRLEDSYGLLRLYCFFFFGEI